MSSLELRALGIFGLCLALSGCAALPRLLFSTDPLSPQEHVTLAAAYRNEKREDLAEREYRAALIKERKFPPALVGLGNLEFERGERIRS